MRIFQARKSQVPKNSTNKNEHSTFAVTMLRVIVKDTVIVYDSYLQ